MNIELVLTNLSELMVLLYLVIASYQDIKTYMLSTKLSLCFAVLFIVLTFLWHYHSSALATTAIAESGCAIITGLIPGIAIILLAYFTHQKIGYGDGILISIIGIALGFRDTFIVCIISFAASAIVAAFIILRAKLRRAHVKQTLPFIPFVLIGYIIFERSIL